VADWLVLGKTVAGGGVRWLEAALIQKIMSRESNEPGIVGMRTQVGNNIKGDTEGHEK